MKTIAISILALFFSCYTYGQKIEDALRLKEPLEINIYGGLNFSYNDYGGSKWVQPSAPYLSFSTNKTGNFSLGVFYAPGLTALNTDFRHGGYPGYLSVGISYGITLGKIKF